MSSLATSGTGGSNRVVGGASTVSTLTINNTSPATYSSALFGASGTNRNNLAVALGPSSAITLNADNTYNGGSTIPTGATLNLGGPAALTSAPAGTGTLRLTGGTLALQGQAHGALSISIYSTAPNNPDNTQFNTLPALQAYAATFTPGVPVQPTIDKPTLDYSDNNYGDGQMFLNTSATTGGYGFTPHDQLMALWTGYIKITKPGNYVFSSTSDDGSMVWIDGGDGVTANNGLPAVNNNNFQGARRNRVLRSTCQRDSIRSTWAFMKEVAATACCSPTTAQTQVMWV